MIDNNDRIYKVYFLMEPENDEVRYVGITSGPLQRRLYSHIAEKRCKHKFNWIKKLKRKGLRPNIKLVKDGLTKYCAFTLEKVLIGILKEKLKRRCLNKNDGGEGGRKLGYVVSDRVKKIISATHLGVKRGPLSEETKLRISISKKGQLKGIERPDYVKEKISKSHKGRFMREDNLRSKPIIQYDLEGKLIKKWPCAEEVYRELKINPSHIGAVCNGKRKTAGGFIWKNELTEDWNKKE